jgi:hypothetical protein
MIVLMGVYPKPFMEKMEPSINAFLTEFRAEANHPALAAQKETAQRAQGMNGSAGQAP